MESNFIYILHTIGAPEKVDNMIYMIHVNTVFCSTSNLIGNPSFKLRDMLIYFDMTLNILEFSSF